MSGLLSVENVVVRFGGVTAVNDVSFELARGSSTGLIGPNGAGKSTLLAALSGSVRIAGGTIHLDGRRLGHLGPARRCHLGMVRTHQTPRPFPGLTVRENLLAGERYGRNRAGVSAAEILTLTGLSPQADMLVSRLSPSDLRKLEMARALATGPSLLLLDEVAAGIPEDEIDDLAAMLRSIVASGVALLMVEHVLRVVTQVVDRLLVLDEGRLLGAGAPAEVLRRDEVREAYLGPLGDENFDLRRGGSHADSE